MPDSLAFLEPSLLCAVREYCTYKPNAYLRGGDYLIINPTDRFLFSTGTQQKPFLMKAVNYSGTSLLRYAGNQRGHRLRFPLLVHIPGFCVEE